MVIMGPSLPMDRQAVVKPSPWKEVLRDLKIGVWLQGMSLTDDYFYIVFITLHDICCIPIDNGLERIILLAKGFTIHKYVHDNDIEKQ